MAARGLAILLGAGPETGIGIARVLSSPAFGNMAVALLARNPGPLNDIAKSLRSQTTNAIETFPTDTSPDSLHKTFANIKAHQSFRDLKLKAAIFSIRTWSKKPFMSETFEEFMAFQGAYVGGAMAFAQESFKHFFEDHGETTLAKGAHKKGTLMFTSTPSSMRCNVELGSHGASRAGVRMLAQALAKEMGPRGIHVAHAIVNGRVADEDTDATRSGTCIAAEAVGKTYLYLLQQEPTLWTHELDLRPAQEPF